MAITILVKVKAMIVVMPNQLWLSYDKATTTLE